MYCIDVVQSIVVE